MEAIELALFVAQSGDDKGEAPVVFGQGCWLLLKPSKLRHDPRRHLGYSPAFSPLEESRQCSSQDESARSDGLVSLDGWLPQGRKEPLLSGVSGGGSLQVVVQCRAMQACCQ